MLLELFIRRSRPRPATPNKQGPKSAARSPRARLRADMKELLSLR